MVRCLLERLAMKRSFSCLLLFVLCAGCTSCYNQYLITVLDQNGRPIRGAGLEVPQQELFVKRARPHDAPSGGSTNSKGLVYVYHWNGEPQPYYILDAEGYVPKVVAFPHDDKQVYVLKRMHSAAERKKAYAEAERLESDLLNPAIKQQAQKALAKPNS